MSAGATLSAPTTGYACLYEPPLPGEPVRGRRGTAGVLVAIAQEFSPRYERHRDDLVSIDISGLERLMRPGAPRVDAASLWTTIGEELRREAADRGVCVHVAVASTRTAAMVLACARPGLTVVPPGGEPSRLAPLPIRVLGQVVSKRLREGEAPRDGSRVAKAGALESALPTIEHWGVRTLGELAALPSGELAARLGRQGLVWQAIARGEDVWPLVPTLPDERFESSIDLEWPIEGTEPLSFVLTRLLEPLSVGLERRDRGAAVLRVTLRLTTREIHERRLRLPSPVRDVRTLRTLALLDLESHPPGSAIDRVTVTIEPTPGRVLQHTLFARPQPTPDQLSTLLARLGALMGQDRIGAAARVDSFRPGAFEMRPFAPPAEGESLRSSPRRSEVGPARGGAASAPPALWRATPELGDFSAEQRRGAPRELEKAESLRSSPLLVSALRRCRQPVPARVVTGTRNVPTHVTARRRGLVGGAVIGCAGPWRTSGCWWSITRESPLEPENQPDRSATLCPGYARGPRPECVRHGGAASAPPALRRATPELGVSAEQRRGAPCSKEKYWNRDEWDVALSDGAVYRLFRDCSTDAWFIDAIVD